MLFMSGNLTFNVVLLFPLMTGQARVVVSGDIYSVR